MHFYVWNTFSLAKRIFTGEIRFYRKNTFLQTRYVKHIFTYCARIIEPPPPFFFYKLFETQSEFVFEKMFLIPIICPYNVQSYQKNFAPAIYFINIYADNACQYIKQKQNRACDAHLYIPKFALQRTDMYRKISRAQRASIWFTNVQKPFQTCSVHLLYILHFELAVSTYTYPKHFLHVAKFSAPIYVQNSLRLQMYKTLCAYMCTKLSAPIYIQNILRLHMYKTMYAYICIKLSAPIYIYTYIYIWDFFYVTENSTNFGPLRFSELRSLKQIHQSNLRVLYLKKKIQKLAWFPATRYNIW